MAGFFGVVSGPSRARPVACWPDRRHCRCCYRAAGLQKHSRRSSSITRWTRLPAAVAPMTSIEPSQKESALDWYDRAETEAWARANGAVSPEQTISRYAARTSANLVAPPSHYHCDLDDWEWSALTSCLSMTLSAARANP